MARGRKADDSDDPLSRQSLKAAVWYTVTKIAQEEELSLPFAASEHFVAALAEVVFQQALSLGKDLESFAKHAGRLTINADDVKLAARRNEPMYESLSTAAIQHGLTLADLRADTASTSRAGSSKPKAVKAPRIAAAKPADAAPQPAPKPKKETKTTTARSRTTSSSKGKGKAKVVDSPSEMDDDSDPQLVATEDDEPRGGGFVKASALKDKKGKRRAVESSSDEGDEEAEAGAGSEDEIMSDSSDDRRKKRRKQTNGSKRRKSDAD
ncbi:hypothetical protein B0A53_02324 [Rhodotorula sp. CCFEE 5036]|nr:hypothetical protein B0A53_02324 [Rhodotorula sp. CCFEE 5036]